MLNHPERLRNLSASDSSFGENDNRNTIGKTTHTPQLKALRLDNPSLREASRHE
jgi:hypothetical protein